MSQEVCLGSLKASKEGLPSEDGFFLLYGKVQRVFQCEQGRSHTQYSIGRTANFWLKVPRTIKRVLSAQGFLIIGIAGTGQGIDFFIRSQVISRTRLTSWVRTAGLTQVPLKLWG